MTDNSDARGQMPPLMINAQYIKDFSFEAPNTPHIFQEMTAPPGVNVSVDIDAQQLNSNQFEVILNFMLEGKLNDKVAFIIELSYASVVTVNVPNEHIQPLIMIEVPRMMFPFARAIVADVTRDSGFPPLMIAPIDFVHLYRQRVEAAAGSQAEA